MGNIHVTCLTVPACVIDINRHVNNLAYLHWIQGLFIEHAVDNGYTIRHLRQHGGTWVMVANAIEYFSPGCEGDHLAIFSWIDRLGTKSLQSRFLFYRAVDDTVIAEASTTFVCVDAATGRGMPLPVELRDTFAPAGDEHPVLRALRAEMRDMTIIAPALAAAHSLSDVSVNSFALHSALVPPHGCNRVRRN
jgi:YbgC/YbaW family acyl-CoA thioester hydrolase